MLLRLITIAGLILVLIGVAPIASVLIAGLIAEAAGCELHEGFVNPCVIGGKDRGEILYTMFVLGWFMIASIPIGLVGLALIAVAGLAALVRRARR